MKRSVERILTTHVGRLQRPDDLTSAMEADPNGRPTDEAFEARLGMAVSEIVRKQAEAGIDVVCDGEFGKLSWTSYLNGRLGGHEVVPAKPGDGASRVTLERSDFADFYRELERGGAYYFKSPGREAPAGMRWACTGPVTYTGGKALRNDLEHLQAAVGAAGIADAFVPATSPIRPRVNRHYRSDDEYFEAVGEAMRTEYRAIVDAGFILQIDDPHLADTWLDHYPAMSVAEYRQLAQRHVEIVNHALRGIPEERIRYHVCWGSWHGPHVHDLQMKDIVDVLLTVRAQAYVFEAANARHEHEWQVWRDVRLPDGKLLVPGVVGHATNVVEHPELVAWRIANFADLVGMENVIAGTDCGFGYRVHPQIAWAKMNALVVGAQLATRQLRKTG